MSSTRNTLLLLGGTGKVSSRIVPLLSANGNHVLVASRSGTSSSLPNVDGVKFDWLDSATYAGLFEKNSISAVFLVAPSVLDSFPVMKPFIDLAIQNGVSRFVLLGASVIDPKNGPMTGKVSKYLMTLNVDYAIMRPTWFMLQHLFTTRDQDKIITAAGDGKVPFVSAGDIAAVAFRALTDEVPHNTDHIIIGPDLLSYDEVAAILTTELGRQITHIKITEEQAVGGMTE